MADLQCPNCKKNNPDFLDVCQFCQTPLKPEAMVHIGDKPTKKDTGELEPTIPEWLRDIRQQSKESTEEEAARTAFQPKVQKNEPPDLLAGLASQAGSSDDDEVPDWLASLSPAAKPSTPPSTEPETDFFAQFNKSKSEPASAPVEESPPINAPSQPSAEKDELSDWFSQASAEPTAPITFERDNSQIEMGWMDNFDSPSSLSQEPVERPKEEEDLSWLRELEAASKRTGELSSPKQEPPAASQEDLSWLNNLGGISPPAQSTPSAPKEDLSWLDNLGGTSEPSSPASTQPTQPKEDLSWLKDLSGTTQPASPATTPSAASQEDLSWLNNLGGTSEPAPSTPKEDLSWLNNLGGTQEPSPSTSKEDLNWLNNLGGTEPAPPVQSFDAAQDKPSASQEDLNWLKNLGETPEPASSGPVPSFDFA
ncbi:MAG TPA: hypothetical protein VJM08_11340, partial [Anaerolineales bacterium]|nr:hypothetical protein [Anaerolineales bacterium]